MFDKDSGEVSQDDGEEATDASRNEAVTDSAQEKVIAKNDNETVAKSGPPAKRELKGRIVLLRIKKNISKVPQKISRVPKAMKKIFFLPFGSKSKSNSAANSIANCIVISSPKSIVQQMPASPSSSISVISIASSIVTNSNGTTIICVVLVESGIPPPSDRLYGAINYDSRSVADSSTVDGSDDLPPPPPMSISFPPMMASSLDEEDTVSFLAEAMKHFQSDEDEESVLLSFPSMMASSLDDEDAASFLAEAMKHVQSNDDEESVLLLIAPKEEEDGTEEICQFISTVDTPRSQMVVDKSVHEEVVDDDLRSNATSNNLASLFTNDKCNSVL